MEHKLLRNSVNFQAELTEVLRGIVGEATAPTIPAKYSFLKYYQNLLREYITLGVDSRGLLIYHTMGMGKSITAVSIAMELLDTYPPILLLTKSLQKNLRNAIVKYVRMRRETDPDFPPGKLTDSELELWIDAKFTFVSLDAWNMRKQMETAVTPEEALNDPLEEKFAQVAKLASLRGRSLIVDEAHNLFRSITNASKNARAVYDMVIKEPDCKVFFLTGTPQNDPFELVPCFNMLAGGAIIRGGPPAGKPPRRGRLPPSESILPDDYHEFYRLYVDAEANRIKSKEKFQNRIFGLVSYVSSDTFSAQVEFPTELPVIVCRVPMSPEQWVHYVVARDKEKEEMKGKRGPSAPPPALSKPKPTRSSTYRVKSRMISNHAPGVAPSSKHVEILRNVNRHPGTLGLVYSQFKGNGGLRTFRQLLLAEGWKEVEGSARLPASSYAEESQEVVRMEVGIEGGGERGGEESGTTPRDILQELNEYAETITWWREDTPRGGGKDDTSPISEFLLPVANSGSGPSGKTFATITGDVDPEDRDRIVNMFTQRDNLHGEVISLLLISATGAEGLDLKAVRHVHVMEPYWNYARIAQVVARAVRNDSHKDLPAEERNVQTYVYLAVAPLGEETTEPTTDEELYSEALRKAELSNSFNEALKEVSVECPLGKRAASCRVCAPTGRRLYTDDPARDVELADPCRPISTQLLKAERREVLRGGIPAEVFVAEDPESIYKIKIFTFDPLIGGYRRVPEDVEDFPEIVEQLGELAQ